MAVTLHELEALLSEPEAERLEFKAATNSYEFDKLVEYCAAISNEGGGKVVLGVTDKRPRQIVGTAAFKEPGQTVASLMSRLRVRISASELHPPVGRARVVGSRRAGRCFLGSSTADNAIETQ